MSDFSVTLPNGHAWTPRFVQTLNETRCIGCGRCYRVCGRDVFELVGLTEEGERIVVKMTAADEDDDDDVEYERKVMTIAHQENCVGCEACSRICPKQCHSHAPLSL
ncbi:MAG TPA: ferredoxin III, nif-specific [Pseudomonadales bacterium]|jgi:Nif-specific ferredoxin III|nr:ferredoxin III, nif-specific [Pseudomonadales bacterium]HMW15679.1 ferredoxin III, nif-specific [Pseudomonadales bacterium]HMW83446.1 ferredoxin III, nif-specific [Pseudomonadales bacterium]HMZ71545.1 ferredoxin III, nif-specific [Pseudomonadales bacterium]HMZ92301.1 ferredoxin III, nif-specific [Pseudomonadales bacterium]